MSYLKFKKLSSFCLLFILIINTFAFSQFPRKVLIEEFTSATCIPCVTAGPILNKAVKDNNGMVLTIRYHMNYPKLGDPMNIANKDENNKQREKYGVSGIPDARINGDITIAPTQESEVKRGVSDELKTKSPLSILVNQSINNQEVTDSVFVTAGNSWIGDGTYKLYCTLIQNHLYYNDTIPNTNGEKEFFDVFVKTLPNLLGENFSIKKGETKNYVFKYSINSPLWEVNKIFAIAYVQDIANQNKIIQCGSAEQPKTDVKLLKENENAFVYPNPTTELLTCRLKSNNYKNVNYSVYDVNGKMVLKNIVNNPVSNTEDFVIDVSSLLAGTYVISIYENQNLINSSKFNKK
jgi:hypothetical protein